MSTSEGRLATPPVQLLTCCKDAAFAPGAAVKQSVATSRAQQRIGLRISEGPPHEPVAATAELFDCFAPASEKTVKGARRSSSYHQADGFLAPPSSRPPRPEVGYGLPRCLRSRARLPLLDGAAARSQDERHGRRPAGRLRSAPQELVHPGHDAPAPTVAVRRGL